MIEAGFDQVPGMVVTEAPESGFHEVEERPYFVVVEYSLSTGEVAAFLGLVDATNTSLVNQEETIMGCYKGEARVDRYSEFTEAVDYSI